MTRGPMIRIALLTYTATLVAFLIGCEMDLTHPSSGTNVENKYEWVGNKHNDCVNWVMDKVVNFPPDDRRAETVLALVKEYFSSDLQVQLLTAPPNRRKTISNADFQLVLKVALGGKDAYCRFLDSLSAEGAVSESFVKLSTEILGVINNDEPTSALDEFVAKINSEAIEDTERDLLLAQVAIAKHSRQLWRESGRETIEPFPILGVPPAAIIAGMDVIGGVATSIISRRSGNSWGDAVIDGLIGGAAASACGALGIFR